MSDVKITSENMFSYPIGTKVVMMWGAMYPTEEALVVDYNVRGGSEHFPDVYELVLQGETGTEHSTSCLVTKGVGIYLEDVFMGRV